MICSSVKRLLRIVDLLAIDSTIPWRDFRGAGQKPWSPLWFKGYKLVIGALGIFSFLFTADVLYAFSRNPSAILAFDVIFFGGCTAIYILLFKRLWEGSKPFHVPEREATFNIQGDYDVLVADCIAILKKMKVQIRAVGLKGGVI